MFPDLILIGPTVDLIESGYREFYCDLFLNHGMVWYGTVGLFSVINFINCFVCREFEVESLNFAGQVHKWQLSQLLQKGTERSQESLLSDLALALRFIIVTARGRLFSHFFSLYEALRALLTGLLRLLGKMVNSLTLVLV
jgi:hypothetical protein